MTIHTHLRLVDGPVVLPEQNTRSVKVANMAKVLIETGTFHDEHDARLALRFVGYSAFEVQVYVDDARQVAEQHVVAREMAR